MEFKLPPQLNHYHFLRTHDVKTLKKPLCDYGKRFLNRSSFNEYVSVNRHALLRHVQIEVAFHDATF